MCGEPAEGEPPPEIAEERRKLREKWSLVSDARYEEIHRQELRAADSEPPALRVFRENEP